jgi:6-phosphofructokinase 1
MCKFRVLVADNDASYRESLIRDVLPPDYEPVEAENPERAKEKLDRELIHLALVDIRLRNDDDDKNDDSGLQLCNEIDPSIPRIILTGFPAWAEVRQAMGPQTGGHRRADAFIDKKEGRHNVRKIVSQVLADEYEVFPQQRFAVLTSGGDSPGMNAAIWAIVRAGLQSSVEVFGVYDGYRGLVENKIQKLRWNDVSNIVERGGTILGTARYEEFQRHDIREHAVDNLLRKHISGLIVIGGDGSMNGAKALAAQMRARGASLHTIALPGTIDNDLYGTDMSLGADSAAQAIIAELRNLIAPAQALGRVFVVEVMGRYAGYLALAAGLGVAADAVIVPEESIVVRPVAGSVKSRVDLGRTLAEFPTLVTKIARRLELAFTAGKRSGFVVLSEGVRLLTNRDMAKEAEEVLNNEIKQWPESVIHPDVRVQVLGHPVRGVPPSRHDVWLGSTLGDAAVQALLQNKSEIMLGWSEEKGVTETLFDVVVRESNKAPVDIWTDRPKWRKMRELLDKLATTPVRSDAAQLTKSGQPLLTSARV